MPPILNKWNCLEQAGASSDWVWLEAFCFSEIESWLELVKVLNHRLLANDLPGPPRSPQLPVGLGAPSPAEGRSSGATSPAGLGANALLNGLGLTQFRGFGGLGFMGVGFKEFTRLGYLSRTLAGM